MKLDTFTKAYIQTALWSSTDDNGEPLDRTMTERDIAPATLTRIIAECLRFQDENAQLLTDAIEAGVKCGPDFDATGRAGHDFWLTRNGHGAAFWDGDWQEPFATKLTDAAKSFGQCDLYIGDDGLLYL